MFAWSAVLEGGEMREQAVPYLPKVVWKMMLGACSWTARFVRMC